MALVYKNKSKGKKKKNNNNNNNENKKKDIISQQYVHSTSKHVHWNYALTNLKKNKTNNLGGVLQRYNKKLNDIVNMYDVEAAKQIETLDNFNDETLVAIFEKIAEQSNKKVEELFSDKTTQLVDLNRTIRKTGSNLLTEKVDDNQFKLFMDSILNALKLVSSLSDEQWQEFVKAYDLLIKKAKIGKMSKTKVNKATEIISGFDLKEGQEIVSKVGRYLLNIANSIQQDKNHQYTANQMSSSLNNILDTAIGEYFALIESDVIFKGDSIVTEALKSKKKGFRYAQSTGQKTAADKKGGKTISGSASKVDVYKRGGLEISLGLKEDGNDSYVIWGQLNSSVKWYDELIQGKNKGKLANDITLYTGSHYIDWLKKIFSASSSSMYAIYNTLVFNNTNVHGDNREAQEAYRIMRSQVLQNYLEVFIAGKGGKISGSGGGVDLASFLIVNGKFYSIPSILYAYMQQAASIGDAYGSKKYGQNEDSHLAFISIDNPTIDNTWENPVEKNLAAALTRSNKAKKEVYKIGMRVQLNSKILEDMLMKYRITPIA